MPNKKISQFTSVASAGSSLLYPVVSGSNNKVVTQHTQLVGLGIPQYQEATCRATATVAILPADSSIFDIYVKVLARSSATDGGSDVEIGFPSNYNGIGLISTSGLNIYRFRAAAGEILSPSAMQKTSGAITAVARSATANASFVVGIGYFRT